MSSLSHTGRLTLLGALGLCAGGLVGGVGSVSLAGSAVLSGLCLAWVAGLSLARRMRRERLEFTWWVAARPGGAVHPDDVVLVRVALRNPTDGALVFGTARLALSAGVRHARVKGARVEVPPRSVATFELEVRPSHAGRHVLHGAWMTLAGPLGLSWSPLYFPNPLVLEVEPRGASALGRLRPKAPGAPAQRAGRATRRAGEGPELRELRDYQPGDPYRRIAWKASARRGKLVVRETEDEAQTTRVLVLDASATMRGDDRGGARIDYAIELAAQAARMAHATGDRLGLVGFDARVVAQVPPGDGAAHLRAVVAAAVDLRALVDEDLTDVDDETLADTVARYFREQEGLDVSRGAPAVDVRGRLAELAERALATDPSARLPVLARDAVGRSLRAFCRARAITLPLRHDPSGAAKGRGLADALRAAVERAREARTVLVLSDLEAVGDLEPLRQALGAARVRHHRITFVAPAGEDFRGRAPVGPGEAPLRDALATLFLEEERDRLRELRNTLASLGVPLYTAQAQDPVLRWLHRSMAPRASRA
jgi:uncharacterized protein (DUF58 family)